jgi:serine protease AprX
VSSTFLNRRRSRRAAAFAVVAVIAPLTLAAGTAHAVPTARARLAAVADTAPERKVVAIVRFGHDVSERAALTLVRAHGGRVAGRLPLIHGLAVRLPARAARGLVRVDGVAGVTLNTRVRAQGITGDRLDTSYPRTVNAPRVWEYRHLTGKGVGVAVIDTGVNGDMVDFKGQYNGASRVVANVVTNPLATTAGDGYGHGTHVAGIIAGNSFNRSMYDPAYGDYVGVAPEADLITVKASDDAGNATVLDVINGLQFVVDHKDTYNIRVVNLSLSSATPSSYRDDPLSAAAEAAWFKGIVVVAAAGNRGTDPDAVRYAPGNDPYVITVGGTDDGGTSDRTDDRLATWSSRGTTQDGFAKPDVVAPGAHIQSTLALGSAFQALCPTCIVPGNGYIRAGGTSMAAPQVAGAAALLLQAHPDWTPDQVKSRLIDTDRAVTGSVAGTINADAAIVSGPITANRGLTPNNSIDPVTGAVDPTRSSWSRSSWSTAADGLAAGWARSSWSCSCATAGAAVDPTRSSWSRSSWSSGPNL